MFILKNRGDFPSRIPAFDTMRLFAIALIALYHGLVVNKLGNLTTFHDLTIGQFGVGIFCALSGFLAFRDRRPPKAWALRRLIKLYPAYWIITLISFIMAWFTGYKHIDVFLFCSQMLGTGFFTHGWNLVNSITWFFSLLLVCYGIAFIAKISKHPLIVLTLAAMLSVILILVRVDPSIPRHVISFSCAAMVGILPLSAAPLIIAVFVFVLTALSFVAVPFVYGAAALVLVLACLLLPNWSTKGIGRLSPYIYEFFLAHGIFFLGAAKIIKGAPLISIPLGTVLSIGAAWGLKKTVDFLTRRISKLPA